MHQSTRRRTLWDRFWERRARQLWKRTGRAGIAGAIDTPRPGQRFVNGFQLKGWVDAPSVVVTAYLDGRNVWEGSPGGDRNDVSPTARQFDTFIPAGRLSTRRFAWLTVTARRGGAADADALTLHSFHLRRGDGGRQLPRWAYGRVWDRDASTVADAMNAVAGYTDAAEWERSGRDTAAHLMHLDEWDRFRYVKEFWRVLRPGGRVYFDNFDLRSPDGWTLFLQMAALDVAVRPPNVSKASTEQELTWYAERAGFDGIASETGQLWVTVTARKP